jgi:hypothetical protein
MKRHADERKMAEPSRIPWRRHVTQLDYLPDFYEEKCQTKIQCES